MSAGRMWRRRVACWLRDERGTAVVEFAIIVPVLLIILLAIIDFGRMMAVAASLAAAVRDGARQGAAMTNVTDADQVNAIKARVVDQFQPFGGTRLSASNVSVTTTAASDGSLWNVNVKVSNYTYVPITPIAQMIGMGAVTLTRTAVFRWERTS